MPAPLSHHESARLAALRDCGVLDTPPEVAFDRIVGLAADTLDMPMASISFVDHDRLWRKAARGLPAGESPLEASFCAHAIIGDGFLVVPDAAADARFARNPAVTGAPGIRFYAGAVLRIPAGQPLGTLCVFDRQPRELDERKRKILRDLADLVVDELSLRTRCQRLNESQASSERRTEDRTEELSRANQALLESESRFRQLFNQASDAALVHDADGRLVDVNEAACASLGYSRAELLTMGVPDLEITHTAEGFRFWRELEAGSIEQVEGCHRRKDGTTFPVEVHVSVLDTAQGRRLLAVTRDITERKRGEAALRVRALQQEAVASLGTRALSGDSVEVLLREAVTLIGRTVGVELCRVFEHLPAEKAFVAHAGLNHAAGKEGRVIPGHDIDYAQYVMRTGLPAILQDTDSETRFVISAAVRSLGIKSGLCVLIGGQNLGDLRFGVLALASRERRTFSEDDVFFVQSVANTLAAAIERRQGETALRAAKEEAERANHAKSMFLSRMSHELRTPLNAILGFGQLLELSTLDAVDASGVKYILKGGRHLLSLIDEVLDLSRAETGELHLVFAHVDVNELVRECLGLVAQLAQGRGITCRVKSTGHPVVLWSDEQRLRQMLLNLLSNAIKYNREGGQVLVSCEPVAAGRVRLKISDTGPGISAGEIARLFVPFERLEQTYGEVEDTGLGLVVSRRLAEALGGTVGVESEVGQGSTFWIELPGAETQPGKSPLTSHTGDPAPGAPGAPPQATLLYIEDNQSNLQVVQSLLAKCRPSWRFLSAMEGGKGLSDARADLPDLIFLDLQLPGMPGDRVLAELRRDRLTRHIPVIVLSADATAHSRERLLASGANDYLTKPFRLDNLLEVADRTLGAATARPLYN